MKKLIIINLFLVIALVACGTKPTPTSAPASGPATNTPGGSPATKPSTGDSPTATGAPDSSGSSNSNDSSGSSGSSSDCADKAAFVADVTVQDNELFAPGTKFEKTWRIKNTGTCTWTGGYRLVLAKGEQIKAPDSVTLKETPPGSTLDISVTMIAPTDPDVTHARADFEIKNPGDQPILIDDGTYLWVIIKVDNGEAPKNESGGTGGGGATSAGPGYASVSCGFSLDQSKINEVLAAINAYRAQQGAPAYTVDAQLSEAAQAHANDMACNQLFYHNGSNGSTPKSRVAASGYIASFVTENVYGSWPPLSGPDAISWWANDTSDPRHNENLLSAKYIEIGIGYAFFNNYGYYVIDFAVP